MKSLLIILFYLTGIQSVKKCHEKANNYYLKNGQLVDVEKNSIYSSDILIKNGKIEAIGSNIYLNNSDYNIDYKVIDLKNKLVTPGLIDMHVHAYYGGTYWGIKPERSAIESGVTTILDTGSAGCFTFTNFKETVISNSPLSIYSFINIVGQGLVLRTGELMNTELSLDFNSTLDIIEENLEFIKGIKVRLDKFTTKDGDLTGLFMARKIATKFNIPLMIHIGHSPPTIEDIEPYLIQGDIITHFYNGHGNKLILEDYKTPKDVLIKLFNKGVLFDVGHGGGGFNFKVALPLIQSNYLPNTISSDLHQLKIY
ncbi:Metallo-dependent hydrolase [Neoconidiobolus thromboides FSU 785]|nr:Metallo-dependent hydrolase [Neoconidiobolus thromboides FSU 785]